MYVGYQQHYLYPLQDLKSIIPMQAKHFLIFNKRLSEENFADIYNTTPDNRLINMTTVMKNPEYSVEGRGDKLDELLIGTKPEKLEEEKRVSMFPVNFARGMNWTGKCIILDEAQNSTIKEITTVLTRMGPGSRCFVLADPMQTDLRGECQQGAFEKLGKIFSDDESAAMGIYNFDFTEEDIMRSELVKFIVQKINQEGENHE